MCTVPRPSCLATQVVLPYVDVVLRQKVRALVDTGSMQSLVRSDLVPVVLRSHTSVAQIVAET